VGGGVTNIVTNNVTSSQPAVSVGPTTIRSE
jgi:hypothetical protein